MFNYNTCVNKTSNVYATKLIFPLDSTSPEDIQDTLDNQQWLVEQAEVFGVQLMPVPEALLLVKKKQEQAEPQVVPHLVTFWNMLPLEEQPQLWGAKVAYVNGQEVLVPWPEKTLWSWEVYTSPGVKMEYPETPLGEWNWKSFLELYPDQVEVFMEIEQTEKVYIDEFSTWWMGWVHREWSKFPPGVMVEIATRIRPGLKPLLGDDGDVGVTFKKKALAFQFWFGTGRVISNTGSEMTLMENCSIGGLGFPSRPLTLTLALMLGGSFNGSVPAFLNDIPNAWERDEGSYGLEPEVDHPTRVINSDLKLPLAAVRKLKGKTLGVFPWVIPQNGVFTNELIGELIDSEGASVPDKYNMKSATGVLGCMAMLLWMGHDQEGTHVVLTGHDASKLNKLCNRGPQARLYKFLLSFLLREEGEEQGREQSLMKNSTQYSPSIGRKVDVTLK